MFIDNKYKTWYYAIIQKAKTRLEIDGYFEKHHIVPKCLGGTDDLVNLVKLTSREHYVCHRLLVKMVAGQAKYKMDSAVFMMALQSRNHKGERLTVSSRQYTKLKELHSDSVSARLKGRKLAPFSEEHKRNISKAHTGKTATPEVLAILKKGRECPISKAKRISTMTGKTRSDEAKINMSLAQQARDPSSWKPVSEATKKKISKSSKGKGKPFKGKPSPHIGRTHTATAVANMKAGHAERVTMQCEHCNETVPKPNYSRWHGNNCKSNPDRIVNLILCNHCHQSFDSRAFKRWHGENCKTRL